MIQTIGKTKFSRPGNSPYGSICLTEIRPRMHTANRPIGLWNRRFYLLMEKHGPLKTFNHSNHRDWMAQFGSPEKICVLLMLYILMRGCLLKNNYKDTWLITVLDQGLGKGSLCILPNLFLRCAVTIN